MSEETQEQVIAKGRRAYNALHDDVLQEAFEALDAAYIESWRTETDGGRRGVLWMKCACLQDLQVELKKYVERGIQEQTGPRSVDNIG